MDNTPGTPVPSPAYFDTHVHVISEDEQQYPPNPLGGNRSEWSLTRPVDIDQLVQHLDRAGIDKAVVVQASTVYGFDNRYAARALRERPDRMVGVCSVDFAGAAAVQELEHWVDGCGFAGARLRIADGLTKVKAPTVELSDARMKPAWDFVEARGLPVCVQMHSKDTPRLIELLEQRPGLTIVLDHAGRPDASGGPPYRGLDELGRLSRFPGVHLKFTPSALKRLDAEPGAEVVPVVQRLTELFGADHLIWGSDFPAFDGTLLQARRRIDETFGWLDPASLRAVLGENAARLYPGVRRH